MLTEFCLLISFFFPRRIKESRSSKREREKQNEDNLLTLWPLVAVGLRALQSDRQEGDGARRAQSIERGKTFSNSLCFGGGG